MARSRSPQWFPISRQSMKATYSLPLSACFQQHRTEVAQLAWRSVQLEFRCLACVLFVWGFTQVFDRGMFVRLFVRLERKHIFKEQQCLANIPDNWQVYSR